MGTGSKVPLLGRMAATISGYLRLLFARDTPWRVRLILGAAMIYVIWPYDILPDWILGLGIIDDFAVVTALVWWALKLVEKQKGKNGQS
jgi:uncharacterized membrane protein YkvA (DUF1232 family)